MRGSGAVQAASMLYEPTLPPCGLDTIFLSLTFNVTGEPKQETGYLLAAAPPAGDRGCSGRLVQALPVFWGQGGGQRGPASRGPASWGRGQFQPGLS